ncbi:MAG: hypothetical protein ACI8Z7_000880, partial [Candidatus Nanohaloarchaea archaeon]
MAADGFTLDNINYVELEWSDSDGNSGAHNMTSESGGNFSYNFDRDSDADSNLGDYDFEAV